MSSNNRNQFVLNRIPKNRQETNERERLRTYSVNSAFAMLRNLIPTEPPDRKLSKIETLRLACSYISHLASILVTGEGQTGRSLDTPIPQLSIRGTCEKSTEAGLSNDLSFAQRSQICTFCVTSARLNIHSSGLIQLKRNES